jgi:hypothetical protein
MGFSLRTDPCAWQYRSADAALSVICDFRANYSQLHMSFADGRVAKETGAAAIFAVLIVIVPAAYLTMRFIQRRSAVQRQREQDAGDKLLGTPPDYGLYVRPNSHGVLRIASADKSFDFSDSFRGRDMPRPEAAEPQTPLSPLRRLLESLLSPSASFR